MGDRATLTEWFVHEVDTPGRYGDGRGGHGLSLLVKGRAAGGASKSFAQRVRIDGREHNIGLGAYPAVTLAEARQLAKANAVKIRKVKVSRKVDALLAGLPAVQTVDTPVQRPVVPALDLGPTVRDAAETVIKVQRETWRADGKSEDQWRQSLTTYVFPHVGDKHVGELTSADVLAVLTPIWTAKRETARRVRSRLSTILDWAVAMGFRQDNPVKAATSALPKNGVHVSHHAAVPFADVAAALGRVRDSGARTATKLALELLILTATRSGEVRGARWQEFDLQAATWTIPAGRMKTGREHRVPLSRQAVDAIVGAGDALFDGNRRGLIFPGSRGKDSMISDMTLSKLLREQGIAGTPHGMRSSFRDWAAEKTDFPREVCELALAHVEGSAAERAYRRTDLFDSRRELMQAWGDYVAV